MKSLNLVLSLAVFTGAMVAQETPAGCTDSMLQGTYAVAISGTAPAPSIAPGTAALPGTIQDQIGLVLITFDGKGRFTQTDFVKGTLSGYAGARPATGTYKVSPDCTYTSTRTLPVAPFEIITQGIL